MPELPVVPLGHGFGFLDFRRVLKVWVFIVNPSVKVEF